MRKPDLTHALEVGERVYLREPSNRDEAEIVARNAASLALHRGWVTPPTDARTFAEWMVRCRLPNVQCFLVCRIDDGAIAGVFTLSQIVRRLFQSAYLGYYAAQPFAGGELDPGQVERPLGGAGNGERFGDTMRLSPSKGILDPAAADARQPKEIV